MRRLYVPGLVLSATLSMVGCNEEQPPVCLDSQYCIDTYCPQRDCENKRVDEEQTVCNEARRCECHCIEGTGGSAGSGGTGGSQLVCPDDMEPVTLFDATFLGGWTDEPVVGQSSGTGNMFSAHQEATGGNTGGDPDPYRGMKLTLGVGMVTLWQLNLKDGATWDGAICGLSAQLDGTDLEAGTGQTIYSMALKQDNKVFWTDRFFVDVDGWLRMDPPFDETAFTQFDPADPNATPDFSADGEPIEFGFLAGASSRDNPMPREFDYGVDNWRFVVCPCSPQ